MQIIPHLPKTGNVYSTNSLYLLHKLSNNCGINYFLISRPFLFRPLFRPFGAIVAHVFSLLVSYQKIVSLSPSSAKIRCYCWAFNQRRPLLPNFFVLRYTVFEVNLFYFLLKIVFFLNQINQR